MRAALGPVSVGGADVGVHADGGEVEVVGRAPRIDPDDMHAIGRLHRPLPAPDRQLVDLGLDTGGGLEVREGLFERIALVIGERAGGNAFLSNSRRTCG